MIIFYLQSVFTSLLKPIPIGPALFYSDDRDANNSSLRRKLFGQPDREVCYVDGMMHERCHHDDVMCASENLRDCDVTFQDTSGDSETDGMQTDWNHSPSLSRPLPASSPLQAQSYVSLFLGSQPKNELALFLSHTGRA